MQILWRIRKGFVKDLIDEMPEPKPPYNTISSLIRILEKKKFVGYKAYGKTYEYFPAISKIAYRKFTFTNFVANYFEGAPENVVSFMVNEEELGEDDLRRIIDMFDKSSSEKPIDNE